MKLHKIYGSTAAALLVVFAACFGSCIKNVENGAQDALHYAGVTNIGPGMTFSAPAPTFNGSKPSNFSIERVTFEGEAVSADNFSIDAGTGAISITNTTSMSIGKWYVSVKCTRGGSVKVYDDIFEVNMMPATPESLVPSVEVLVIPYRDGTEENAYFDQDIKASVKFSGESVSVSSFEITGAPAQYFTINGGGEISLRKESSISFVKVLPGKYPIDLKVTTWAGEATYENVMTIDVQSRPLSLEYPATEGQIESGRAFSSPLPAYTGSDDGLVYSILAIRPSTDQITIDAATGAILAAEGNTLAIGDSYTLDVTATNKYGSRNFRNAYDCKVVAFINPVAGFSYEGPVTAYEAGAIDISPAAGMTGDNVAFSLVELPAALAGQLSIDVNSGRLTAPKGNTIPIGSYPVKVKAANTKNNVVAELTLDVVANPNKFTYIRYGNNLGLTPAENYANQFRYWSGAEFEKASIVPATDIKSSAPVKWSVKSMWNMSGCKIADDGTLSFTTDCYQGAHWGGSGLVYVTAVVGEGTAAEFTLTEPVFFDCARYDSSLGGATVTYTPFVLTVSPSQGGSSASPQIVNKDGASPAQFAMDFRRNFRYYNLGGPDTHVNGQPGDSPVGSTYLHSVWKSYFDAAGKVLNTGSKDPVSYYTNSANLTSAYLYIDNAGAAFADKSFRLVVQPNKWDARSKGIFCGQVTAVLNNDGTKVNDGRQGFPIFVWFDEKFKTN